jgi:hypothetical protein
MSKSRWLHTKRYGVGIVLAGALIVVGIYGASAQASQPEIRGIIQFQDRSLCSYSNSFFSKKLFPIVEQVNDSGVRIGPSRLDAGTDLGQYNIPITQTQSPGKLRVSCEGLVVDHVLTQADISSGHVNITLPNSRPVVTNMRARLNGQVVRGVPGGSSVSVSLSATDADGDPLHYAWAATDGSATNTDTTQATWTLPNSRGLHFLYVLVSDGKGGYNEQQLAMSTDGAVVPGVGAFQAFLPLIFGPVMSPPPPVVKPSDHTPSVNHFLTAYALGLATLTQPYWNASGPLDTRVSACAYYRDLGAVGGCTADGYPTGSQLTFSAWKAYWGFGSPSSNEASATYANLADLNLQRDMHTLSRPGPRPGGGTGTDVASYVCNYPNTEVTLSNARLGNNLVACVAFEYNVTNNPATGQPWDNGQPFTKFLTFGPTGDLLLSVNLDGRGEKFIPGACAACHSALYSWKYGTNGVTDPNLRAQFIPYDLDNYAFADLPGLRRQDQEASLRALNHFVLDTGAFSATVELINGWYPTPTSNFVDNFVPSSWQGHEALYLDVVKPSCRMCHITFDPSDHLSFDNYADFAGWKDIIANYVCGVANSPFPSLEFLTYKMPNAKETFDRFWNGIPGTSAVDQPTKLLQFLQAEHASGVTTCALPTWLP